MKVKCLIVDDEPLAIRLLENHISKIDNLEIVATCNSAMKAFEIISNQEIDLLFLDIKMPTMTGIDFLRTIQNPPKTIFTTAYRDFAIESYELDAVDYLLKPITFERFFKAIDRFIRKNNDSEAEQEVGNLGATEDYILLKSGSRHFKVVIQNILYIESLKDYIKIYQKTGEPITSKFRMSEMDQQLEGFSFMRVHRSFIVNTEKITAFSSHDIIIDQHIDIPIGSTYTKTVHEFLDKIKK